MDGGEGKAGEVSHAGGAMYYIEALHPGRAGAAVAVLFALLLCLNSLLTGTVVQVSSAVSAFPRLPALWGGAMFAALVLFAAGGGGRRIMSFTASLVPPLTAVFCALSLYIIIRNAALLPAAAREVIRSAFDFSCGDGQRGIFGGILGSSAALSIRYGVTRGIFSNEAGCGTSPTAHAAANTKSPHHQGCFGVFEVFADTIALCSLTAAVLLISPTAGDGIGGTISAYSYFAGDLAGYVLSASVWLFALATVLCQCYYGMEAAEYLRMKLCPRLSPDDARRIFTWLSAIFCIVGAVIPHGLMWSAADAVISLMTAVNVICILPGIAVAAAELKKAEGKERSTRRLCSGAWSTNRSSKALAPPVRAGRQQDSAAELKR
jgi:AGCS family alanine or glycine:cation symporter